jgi:signal transduction histidine kinase
MDDEHVKVLLIEDNPGDARIIREVLAEVSGISFDVDWADSVLAGLGRLRVGGIDVVLLDLSLPDSRGLETFERVRDEVPEVPVVVLTGLDDETFALGAVREGAQDYLVKGQVDSNLLARSIRYAIERKRVEEKLQELYERERGLRQEREEEISKRVEFTRALVHELKTPLTSVMASSELLVAELPEGMLLSLAKNLNRGASNLNRRIDELLDLARGELGMLDLSCSPVDLLHLLQSVAEYMASAASSQGQYLEVDVPSYLPLVWGDEERLQQVVLNLLSNAIKFTPEGGCIIIRATEQNAVAVIEVQDEGRGMTEAEQQRLFEPYHRLEKDRDRLSGLGLGLSLCRTLVELHGGRIWVNSEKGRGSTFSFSIPVMAAVHDLESSEVGGAL